MKVKTAPDKIAAKPTDAPRGKPKAGFSHERSRSQFMARTGSGGAGSTKKFRYGHGEEFKSVKEAEIAVQLWMKEQQLQGR